MKLPEGLLHKVIHELPNWKTSLLARDGSVHIVELRDEFYPETVNASQQTYPCLQVRTRDGLSLGLRD